MQTADTAVSYCRYQYDAVELLQTKRGKMQHQRPDSMDSFEDDGERDYQNVEPKQTPPQSLKQTQWQAKSEPAFSSPKAAEQTGGGRKSLVVLYVLVGVFLLVSTAALVLVILKCFLYCPPGWGEFQRKCYFLSSDKVTWEKARTLCQNDNGDLAVISNLWEQSFLASRIRSTDHWIGLKKSSTQGNWTWVDGSAVSYTEWSTEKSNNGSQNTCVHLKGHVSGEWTKTGCETLYNFVCEKAGPFWA